MDLRNSPDAAQAESGDWEDLRDAAADQMTSTAKHALGGCLFGLTPDLSDETIRPGEAYLDGNRLRLREAADIDIAGLTRPTGTMVAWVSIFGAYTTETEGTVVGTAPGGGTAQYVRHTRDAIIITVTRGVDAASESAAVKPAVPDGSIVLCDVLLDATTDVDSLTSSPDRRPKCPDDRLQDEDDDQWDAIRAIQATLAATLQSPEQGPTPAATSTVALRIDATWAAGTVPSGAPAINAYRFRWRQAGENWSNARTTDLEDVLAYMFTVPDADSDIEMQVAAGNSNGFGEWSDIGTIAAADIEDPPPLQTRTFSADEDWDWPYPQSTQARITLTGGGGGGGGGGGEAGNGGSSGGGGGGGPNGGGGGGGASGDGGDGNGDTGSSAGAGAGGSAAGTGTAGDARRNAFAGGDGGDGGDASGGGGGGGSPNADSLSGHGGDGGSSGGSGGQKTSHGGGGGGGAGEGGGDGGDGNANVSGGGGGGGAKGGDGEETAMTVVSRSISSSATGGPGGGGGGGGGNADGQDGTSSGGGGAGGTGGTGGNSGTGDGGDGAAGVSGQQVIVDVSGLQVGDTFSITIGGGGVSGGGGGGGGGGVSGDGNGGSAGSTGDAGRVTIEPLT